MSMGRGGHLGILLIFALGLTSVTAVADPPPTLFAQATAPFPKKEEDALRKRLEALSAKKSWAKANALATERLGEHWCRPEVALEFRTFAALGVVARQVKKPDLSLDCAIRSLNLADSEIERGMAHFELFLLVDAMKPAEFRAFLVKVATLTKDHCNDPRMAECCAETSGLDIIATLRYSPLPKLSGDALSAAQRDALATTLLGWALRENPSRALMARYAQRTGRADTGYVPEDLLFRLEGERFGSLKDAKLAARSSSKKSAKQKDRGRGKAVFSRDRWESVSAGSWTVYDGLLGYHYDGECDENQGPNHTDHYFIVGSSDGFWLFRDPTTYFDNACGGYGDSFETFEPSVAKTPNGEVLTTGATSSSYVNGAACGASGWNAGTQIMCAKNGAGEPNCLIVSYSVPWSLEGRQRNDKPFVRLDKRGRVNFDLENYSSEVREILRPIDKKSVLEVYEKLPEVLDKMERWSKGSD